MPYPDGTPTGDDHAAAALHHLNLLTPTGDNGPAMGRGYWSMYEAAQVDALRAIGHALLAIHAVLAGNPLPGYTEVTDPGDIARTFLPIKPVNPDDL